MRYKLTLEYDGTTLLGWQRQLDGPSAQEFLEKALQGITGQSIEVVGAGRTDAGVHALKQVAHIDLDTKLDTFRIREALNAHLRQLEAPVSVLEVEPVPEDFHARFSATIRIYTYRLLNRRAPAVLDQNRVWWVPIPLDVEKMQQAAAYLLGNHDFTSFRAASCQAQTPIKTLDRLDIKVSLRGGDADAAISSNSREIIFTVEARSFLHHQVRNMVGTLKMVGEGSLEPEAVKTILEAKDRTKAGATAPASGLYLTEIKY